MACIKVLLVLFQAIDLTNCKQKIYDYVESRMSFIAPNLSVIVGASTAAKLMGNCQIIAAIRSMCCCLLIWYWVACILSDVPLRNYSCLLIIQTSTEHLHIVFTCETCLVSSALSYVNWLVLFLRSFISAI